MFFDVLLSILIVVVRENREFHRQVLGTLLILVLATSTIATVLCGRNTMAVSQITSLLSCRNNVLYCSTCSTGTIAVVAIRL